MRNLIVSSHLRPFSLITVLMVAAINFACATVPPRSPNRASPNVIRSDAIERMNASTAFEIISLKLNRAPTRALRGGAASFERPQEPVIVIDGIRSEIKALHTLPASDIEEIRFLNAGEGMNRFGTGASNGVIEIYTKRGT
ncbi:MAG: hypothetical protein WEE89_06300 [Gemmatimonadota bacterium]